MSDAESQARSALAAAGALLITAGAGMGVDSGLPDFRGDDGFWRAYPPFAKLGLRFVDLANPAWFRRDPELAWGFYGHRLELYRRTVPHAGFERLRRFAAALPGGAFVFTSNVDGQFQRAGFAAERICEAHGSIHHAQCVAGCSDDVWECADEIAIDLMTMRAQPPLPGCPRCGSLARPNVLMFGDGEWVERRTAAQERRLAAWLDEQREAALVIVELGAGTAVPTVRMVSERIARRHNARLIRINPREAEVPAGEVSLPLGARAGVNRILPG